MQRLMLFAVGAQSVASLRHCASAAPAPPSETKPETNRVECPVCHVPLTLHPNASVARRHLASHVPVTRPLVSDPPVPPLRCRPDGSLPSMASEYETEIPSTEVLDTLTFLARSGGVCGVRRQLGRLLADGGGAPADAASVTLQRNARLAATLPFVFVGRSPPAPLADDAAAAALKRRGGGGGGAGGDSHTTIIISDMIHQTATDTLLAFVKDAIEFCCEAPGIDCATIVVFIANEIVCDVRIYVERWQYRDTVTVVLVPSYSEYSMLSLAEALEEDDAKAARAAAAVAAAVAIPAGVPNTDAAATDATAAGARSVVVAAPPSYACVILSLDARDDAGLAFALPRAENVVCVRCAASVSMLETSRRLMLLHLRDILLDPALSREASEYEV